ncbi:MAG TPA: hypothetical protein VIJ33_05150, partial [Solirubrobacteraceae bacterium]
GGPDHPRRRRLPARGGRQVALRRRSRGLDDEADRGGPPSSLGRRSDFGADGVVIERGVSRRAVGVC